MIETHQLITFYFQRKFSRNFINSPIVEVKTFRARLGKEVFWEKQVLKRMLTSEENMSALMLFGN